MIMAFFSSAINILQTLVVAIGAGLGVWGVINLMEGYGNDNPGAKGIGVKYMDFKVFDTTKIDEYSKRAKEQWGQTSEYKEFEEKTKNWTKDDEATVANEFMQLFVEFGQMKEMDPEDEQVQLQVRKLQDYITDHFYTCSDKILCGLGRMYAGGGELTENIDDVGGVGTAEFASKAIDIFYMSRR